MKNKVKLWLLCGMCHQLCPCGPKSTGYSVMVPTLELVEYAPVIKLSLQALRAAGMVGHALGYKLPIPETELISDLEEVTTQLLGNSSKDFDDASCVLVGNTAQERVQKLTDDSYRKLEFLLDGLDPSHSYYGESIPIITNLFILMMVMTMSTKRN